MFYLEKIVNTVKSKTDELRSVLDFGAPDAPQTAQQCTPDQKIKRLEDEIQKHIKNSEKLGGELQTQQDANKDLRKAVVIQERNFRAFLKSYNARCLELDSQKDEAGRHSVWFNEQMLSFNQVKTAMGNSIAKKDKELQSKLVATGSLKVILKLCRYDFSLFHHLPQEPILHDLTKEDSVENPQKEKLLQKSQLLMHDSINEQKKTIDVIAAMEDTIVKRLVVNIICVFVLIHILTHPIHWQTFIDPIDKETAVCAVPMRNGCLISLKHVYNSWKNDGVKNRSIDWNTIPPFRMPGSSDSDTLADPDQILLIHHITRDLGISTEPPFKVQYKQNQEEEEWRDIDLTDQIRIASVMYQLKHTQGEASKINSCCMVHQNQLLVEVTLGQKVFEFKLFEVKLQASGPIEELPSRFIVSDSSYELF